MTEEKVRISARVTPRLNADIEKICEVKGLTKSSWIITALSNEVLLEKQKMGLGTPDSVAKMLNGLSPEVLALLAGNK